MDFVFSTDDLLTINMINMNMFVLKECPVRMRLILEIESERCYIMATTNIEHDHSKCTRKKNNKSQRHRIHRIHKPLLNLTNRMI